MIGFYTNKKGIQFSLLAKHLIYIHNSCNNRKIMECFAVDHKCLPLAIGGYILSRNKDVYKFLAYNIKMNQTS